MGLHMIFFFTFEFMALCGNSKLVFVVTFEGLVSLALSFELCIFDHFRSLHQVRLADQLFAPAMCQRWLLETPSALANEHSIRCIITRHGCSKIPPQRQAPQVSHK